MRLSKLLERLEGELFYEGKNAEREISSLSHDSRENCKECLYFCLTGGKTDGHMYAEKAIKQGAFAVVTERKLNVAVPQFIVKNSRVALSLIAARYYGNAAEHLKIIGITGTNGKTTTAHMLAAILEAAGKKVGVIGTLGVEYGEKIVSAELTTPDPLQLHKTFAEMFLLGIEYVIMEVSAHALYYDKVAGIEFEACIFTNFTQDHLDFFPSMPAYQQAKSKLFLPQVCKIAVCNGDDEAGRKFGERRGNAKTVYYGMSTPTDAFAVITDEGLLKTECMFNINDELARVILHFTGKYNVYNALAAASCAIELGVSAKWVANGLSELKGVDGRLESVGKWNGAHIFVDFAHTPDGLKQSLSALKSHCKKRLICLFGCGGNRDKSKRAIMGENVAKLCDFCVLTSDNPRYEDPMDILSEVEKGYRRFSLKYVIVPHREKAIEYAMDCLKPGDILLVAGKGGENYQEIMGIKYPFKDNDIIKKTMEKKRL
jgi:UDP-N-acetylmuramyl-tripeptide synthetase